MREGAVMMSPIRIMEFRHPRDWSSATLGLYFTPPGGYAIVQSLPAGEDICPDLLKYQRHADAERMFAKLQAGIESRGYVLQGGAS